MPASYSTVKTALTDPLLLIKLEFSRSVALTIEPFLREFQSPKCHIFYLSDSLHSLLTSLMQRFVRDNVISENSTHAKLIKIDLHKSENLLPVASTHVGFGAKRLLSALLTTQEFLKLRFGRGTAVPNYDGG